MRTTILVCLIAVAACAPLDRKKPFDEPAFVASVDAIGRAVRGTEVGEGTFVAGWARAPIRVPSQAPLAGYGDREGAPHEGTADEVAVRAFVFGAGEHRVLVFSADLLLVDPAVVAAVTSRLSDVPPDRIFFTATHTHSGPGGFVPGVLWEIAFGGFVDAAFEAVVDAHVRAAKEAWAAVEPARIGSASVRVPSLIANRVETNGPVDDELFLLRFERVRDGRVAALWVYGCHAVTRPASNLLLSGDYPADVAAKVDVDLLGFAAGGVGSSNPKHERKTHAWIVNPLVSAVRRALRIAAARSRTSGVVASARAYAPTPRFRYRVTRDVMVWGAPISALVDMPVLTFGSIMIDHTVWAFMPAEMSGELTAAMRRDARRHGVQLAVTSFNGTYVGYIVPRRVYDLPDELAADMHHYESHVMAFFGPYGGDLMVNLGLRMARGVHGRAWRWRR